MIFENLDIEKLAKILADDAFLVDVRTPAEFMAGSVNGAVNIPAEEIENRLEEFENKKNIVVFCVSGNRSEYVKQVLKNNEFDNIINSGSVELTERALKESRKLKSR